MTQEITITFPAISTESIQQLTETETLLAESELALIKALRTKYAVLATLNGYIRISDYSIGNQNWHESGKTWLKIDGAKVHGLLSADYFAMANDSEFAGKYTGERLYLTAKGWVEIKRTGHWSEHQGSDNYWTCDGEFADEKDFDCVGGGIRWLSDEQVAAEFRVQDLAATLAATLQDMAQKIPERMTRRRALAGSLRAATAQIIDGV